MVFQPKKILNDFWGYSSFRSPQEEIIASVLDDKDTLALLPTGGGKSICFQVPAMCKEGVCIVVTPLVALMKDQVENLKKRRVKAIAIHSGMSQRQIDYALDNAVYGGYKFLYVSPERMKTDLFKSRVVKMNVNFIAVDEAHCISQWGYDFRPSYLDIADIRDLIPNVPIVALTATATPKVVEDIQKKLNFKKKNVIKKSFFRENLRYFVVKDENKADRMLAVIRKQGGSGIVYTRSRKGTQDVCDILKYNNVSADFYHAGLQEEDRSKKQSNWMKNKFQVMVCTNAFGMGIDKPDVRFVINYDLPESIEAYFQEAGRGGRDGNKSFAVLLVDEEDKGRLEKNHQNRFPKMDIIRRVYGLVCNELRLAIGSGEGERYGISWSKLATKSDFTLTEITQSANFIERSGYWTISEGLKLTSQIKSIKPASEIYEYQVRNFKFKDLIQVILRSHSGLFDHHVKISETILAKRLNSTESEVRKMLRHLMQLDLIDYVEHSGDQFLFFNQARVDLNKLRIDKEFYSNLQKTANYQMTAMLDYAFVDHQCRSRMLLSYFGEKSKENCGTCDYCVKQKNNEKTFSLEDVVDSLIKVLGSGKMEIHVIQTKLRNSYSLDQINFALKWMLDNGIVLVDEHSILSLK